MFRDVATMDDDGYVSIDGRLKDTIIRGGENVYPVEVEQFLYKHPKIADVQVTILTFRTVNSTLRRCVVSVIVEPSTNVMTYECVAPVSVGGPRSWIVCTESILTPNKYRN